MQDVICGVRRPEMLFIGGEWVEPSTRRFLDLTSPETEQVFARTAEADEADVDRAVAAARRAFDEGPWPTLPLPMRMEAMQRLADALKERGDDLREAGRLQIGGVPAANELHVNWGLEAFARTIELGRSFEFEQPSPGGHAQMVYEPVGVVAAIAPWNSSFMSMAIKLAPALLAGCTVVMKPSPETPLEAYIIAECAEAAGIPPGVINLIPADRKVADYLVCRPGIDKVSFTGSTVAGRRIASVCGERIARYTLELGGKSAAIILDDFDIEAAAKILASTIVMHAGQICVMLSRVIVPQARHDALAAALAIEMKKTRVGYTDDPETQMGPIAMKRQLERIEALVRSGTEQGAKLVCGGNRPAHLDKGYFFEPTLFAHVTSEMRIAQEEIFGPVLALMPCRDIEHGIAIANDTIYGLNSSVFTHDRAAAVRIGRRLRAGNVGQNGLRFDALAPNGGFKQSGIGREGGVAGLMAYLESKILALE